MSGPENRITGAGREGAGHAGPRVRVVHDLHGDLSVRLTEDGGRTTAAVSGEVDHGCAQTVERVLCNSLATSPGGLHVDFSAVAFFDCAGLNALLRTRSFAARCGRPLTVGPVSAVVDRLLALTGTRVLFFPRDEPGGEPVPRSDRPPEAGTGDGTGTGTGAVIGAVTGAATGNRRDVRPFRPGGGARGVRRAGASGGSVRATARRVGADRPA
jgi:anti-anti-sigma factor